MKGTRVRRKVGHESQRHEVQARYPYLKAIRGTCAAVLGEVDWSVKEAYEILAIRRAETEAFQEPVLLAFSKRKLAFLEFYGIIEPEKRERSPVGERRDYIALQKRVSELVKQLKGGKVD